MKKARFRTLLGLVLACAAAACADAPTTPVAADGPGGPRLNTGTPLSVSLSCPTRSGNTFYCTATASGGSGTGYSFTWGGSASEYYDRGGTSHATASCYYYSGSYHGTLSAYTMVTDSQGNTAGASVGRSC